MKKYTTTRLPSMYTKENRIETFHIQSQDLIQKSVLKISEFKQMLNIFRFFLHTLISLAYQNEYNTLQTVFFLFFTYLI